MYKVSPMFKDALSIEPEFTPLVDEFADRDIIFSDKTERLKDGTLVKAGSILGTLKAKGLATQFFSTSDHERQGGLLIWGKPKTKIIRRRKPTAVTQAPAEELVQDRDYVDVRSMWK